MLRRLLHVFIVVLTLIVGATAAAIIVSQTAWFKNWLRAYIVREANQYLNGTLSIGRLGGNLFFGVQLENVGVSMDGSEVVAVKDLGIDYNVFELVSRGLSVESIRIDRPRIYLRKDGDTWSIARLVKKEETEADRSGPGRPIAIDEIGITDGSVTIDGAVGTSGVEVPKRVDRLDAKIAFKYEPVRYSIEISHVSFRASEPSLELNALSGGISVKDDTVFVKQLAVRTAETSVSLDGAVQQYLTHPNFNVRVTSDKTSLGELARIVPALSGIDIQPAYELQVNGPLDRLGIGLDVRSSAGQITGQLTANVVTPGQSVSGEVTVRHLDLAPILKRPDLRSDITSDLKADVRAADQFSALDSLKGSLTLSAPRIAIAGYEAEAVTAKAELDGRRVKVDGRAAAYGTTLTTSGKVVLPADQKALPVFDLKGQARRLDLRRLPPALKVPPAATNVNADYHVAGSGPADVKGDIRLLESEVAGARIAAGSTFGFDVKGKTVAYRTDARVAKLDLERVGRDFKVPALATDRYKSELNAHLVAEGDGTTPREMRLRANGELTDSRVLGGRIPNLQFDGGLEHDEARVKAAGSFAGFDPAVASGKPQLQGEVGGNLDVDATVAGVSNGVTVDSVRATVRASLEPSTLGGLKIDRATIDGDYQNSTGDIRTLEIAGTDINVKASGTLALNETGQSNLTVHADTPSLEQIGKLADVPVTGIAKVDAKVTGNRRELVATGNVTGDGVKYGDNGALTLSTDYTARVRELEVADASVDATSRATFVSLGGQNINELTAKTTYKDKQVGFDVAASQPQRSLNLSGSLLLHPDHQEVHVGRLAVKSQNVAWQTPDGVSPTIQYGGDAVVVKDFALVNGAQRLTADGAFGKPGDTLKVTAKDVDVSTVDAFLLRPAQLTGTLNASADLSGTKAEPKVDARFAVANGGFRQFKYESFGGTVDYSGTGVTTDATLRQNATTSVTAKGYVPLALFSSRGEHADRGAAHGAPVAPGDRIDLHVDSTPIDLGIVQGFTTALTGVSGTAQAKIDVTGSAADPHPTGRISIDKGAFTVASTGGAYANLTAAIDLEQDRVRIERLQLVDNHQNPLSIAGDLAVHELQVGSVDVAIKADDFKVLDNKMGNVRIKSDLHLSGELAAPRVDGDLGITTGHIDLDAVMANMGESAYSTTETTYETTSAPKPAQTPKPGPLDALQMSVHLTVPNDLVIKASDLKTPGSPIGLGAMNLTLGGDLWATKAWGDQVRLVGIVNTVRGTYDFQGRRFTILRDGSVRFEGLDQLDPALDIKAQRLISGVQANVNVRGRLQRPQVVLSSVPPLEQSDILALIVFNQPLNELGEGQQVALTQRAEQMATGALANTLAGSLGRALGLDTFEIQTAPDSGAAAQLTVGQQVGQNVYVKVEQGIGDISTTNLILEYELTNWLRLQTNLLEGADTQTTMFQRQKDSGVDLIFFFSY